VFAQVVGCIANVAPRKPATQPRRVIAPITKTECASPLALSRPRRAMLQNDGHQHAKNWPANQREVLKDDKESALGLSAQLTHVGACGGGRIAANREPMEESAREQVSAAPTPPMVA